MLARDAGDGCGLAASVIPRSDPGCVDEVRMKWLLVIVLLGVGGLAAVVIRHENDRASRSSSGVSAEKIAVISRGETVDVDAHLRAGRMTVVSFKADW